MPLEPNEKIRIQINREGLDRGWSQEEFAAEVQAIAGNGGGAGPQLLAADSDLISTGGPIAETFTITIPPDTLAAGDSLEMYLYSLCPESVGDKAVTVEFEELPVFQFDLTGTFGVSRFIPMAIYNDGGVPFPNRLRALEVANTTGFGEIFAPAPNLSIQPDQPLELKIIHEIVPVGETITTQYWLTLIKQDISLVT